MKQDCSAKGCSGDCNQGRDCAASFRATRRAFGLPVQEPVVLVMREALQRIASNPDMSARGMRDLANLALSTVGGSS